MVRSTGMLTLAILLALSCNAAPDLPLCGRYYGRLMQLQQNGHRALLAAARTSEGKKVIIDYCLQLTDFQVECAIQARTLKESMACETLSRKPLLKRVLPFLNH